MTEKEAIEILKDWIVFQKAHKEEINKADELIEIQETILKALEKRIKNQKILAEEYRKISKQLHCEVKDNLEKSIALEQKDKELKKYKENALFFCDPDKNKECKKTSCYINGGECELTTDIKFRKEREG